MAKNEDRKGLFERIKGTRLAALCVSVYDKQREKSGADIQSAGAKYARRAHLISAIALVLCIVFLLSMLVIFGKDVTPAKMYDFFREVGAMGEIGEGEREEISYSLPTRNQSFAEFKRGFVVASDREIQVFNKAGYPTLTEQMSYSNPQIVASENTFLVYDLGGRGFSVYNSFEDIYIESREYPITAADMTEDGRFAIAARSAKFNTEVIIYSAEGDAEYAYRRSDHTVALKYSPSGKYISLLTLDASEGEYIYTVTVLSAKNGEVVSHVTRYGSLPYSCYYLDGDRLALVCSDKLVIYNTKCEKIGDYEFPKGQLYRVAVSGKNIALMFIKDKVNMKSTVYIINSSCEEKTDFDMYGEYFDMTLSSRYAYFSSDDGVVRFDLSGDVKHTYEINATNGKILVLDSSRIMLCRPNMSYIIDSWS